jgi:23S rRNA (adenine2503-C2)-methyltransferase
MSNLLPVVPDGPPAPRTFYGLSRSALAERLATHGLPRFRADQLYAWVYQKHTREAGRMTDLPRALRERLGELCELRLPAVESVHGTRDGGTHKFVLALDDGARVEAVSMRTARRLTFCISSQVGCALRCAFCATGLMGLERNLRADEVVAQVMAMGDFHRWQDERFNVVFMGMGEPLHNYRGVMDAIRILNDPRGLNLGARRITVSTSGLVPRMHELAGEGMQLGLALSLHATTDAQRTRLMPINRRWPLAEVLDAAKAYGERVGRRVTLEYTLIAGVNDSEDDAERLARFARALPSKINLIPYNPVPGLSWERPSPERVEAFARSLFPRAPAVMVRNTMGGEIWAACGQLGGLGAGA